MPRLASLADRIAALGERLLSFDGAANSSLSVSYGIDRESIQDVRALSSSGPWRLLAIRIIPGEYPVDNCLRLPASPPPRRV